MTERGRGVEYKDVDDDRENVAIEMERRNELEKKLVVDAFHRHIKQEHKLRRDTIVRNLLGSVGEIEPHTDVDGEECVCDRPHLHNHEDSHRDEMGRECTCDAPEEHEW